MIRLQKILFFTFLTDSLVSPSGSACKESAMQETWVQSLHLENLLEESMGTHSNILAGKISWTEEPGRLLPMGVTKSQT